MNSFHTVLQQAMMSWYSTSHDVMIVSQLADLSHCEPLCVGTRWDNKDVWLAGRAHNAITSQIIPIDLSRRSPSYEMRLAKYAKRGELGMLV